MVLNEGAAPRPHEQLPIPLFDGVVLAVRATDGRIYFGLCDLCATLGLDLSSQRRRALTNAALHLASFRVQLSASFARWIFCCLRPSSSTD